MRHYCSLFDAKYLPQGLALYESLKKHSSEDFTLAVLALDDATFQTLKHLDLDIQCMSLKAFEAWHAELVKLRQQRTWAEYCWTLASQLAELVLQGGQPEQVTYLDADLMFFSDPKVIFDEIGDRSIAVIPHRLAENKDKARLSKNGKFNVSWVTFKNTPTGRECLSRWAAQCRERCSAEIGCGDQGYLDEWPERYGKELAIIQNIGAGVAPWNMPSYRVTEGPRVDGKPVVFVHYHEYVHGKRLTNYPVRVEDIKILYDPYVNAVQGASVRIAASRCDNDRIRLSKEYQSASPTP